MKDSVRIVVVGDGKCHQRSLLGNIASASVVELPERRQLSSGNSRSLDLVLHGDGASSHLV